VRRDAKAGKEEEEAQAVIIATREPLLLYLPMAATNKLSIQAAHALNNLQLCRSWFAFIPSRLGRDKIIDACAAAVIKAHDHHFRRDEETNHLGRKHYLYAVSLVRKHLCASDAALLSVALLTLFEMLMKAEPRAVYAHVQGLNCILQARPKSQECSEITRAIAYATADEQFKHACIAQTPSPFEHQKWLDMDPVSQFGAMLEEVANLRKIAHQLLIRLPRFIKDVRRCRQGDLDDDPVEWAKTIRLAHELLELCDDKAETQVLHRVNVVSTEDPTDRPIMTFSYNFRSFDELEATIYYWQTRLMVIKLSFNLDAAFQTRQPFHRDDSLEAEPGFDLARLHKEQERYIANVIMAWQSVSRASDPFGKDMQQALVVLWGALADMQTFRNLPSSVVRSWVLRRFRQLLADWPLEISAATLDEASDLLAGGTRMGSLAAAIRTDETPNNKVPNATKLYNKLRLDGGNPAGLDG